MHKHNLNDLIEFVDKRFNPKVLTNEADYRMVLLSMRAGQSIPEHGTPGRVTVYSMRGHITFYEGETSCELRPGEVVSVAAGSKHRVVAHEDSVLLVLATGGAGDPGVDLSEELDLRPIPRPERHPLIFAKFDLLEEGSSFRLLNDHDPVPLHRQFESIRPGQASWEYIERGPSLFRIRIRRIAASGSGDVPLSPPFEKVQIKTAQA